jgi:hypothetical protein
MSRSIGQQKALGISAITLVLYACRFVLFRLKTVHKLEKKKSHTAHLLWGQ